MQPVIKWAGSKRSQAKVIISYFPKEIETYCEPFLGGGSVLLELLKTKDIEVAKFIASDVNQDLINLWNCIKNTPNDLISHYTILHKEFNSKDIQHRKDYFNLIRKRYNELRDPKDFFFISRTTTNGLIRYNRKGEFNNSCHFSRPGINPETIAKIILETAELIKDVEFLHLSYDNLVVGNNDFLYLDPPYFATNGMYFGGFEEKSFFNWVGKIPCKWVLSYDGLVDGEDNTYAVPKDLYIRHEFIESGLSSFRRLMTQTNKIIHESLYLNYE